MTREFYRTDFIQKPPSRWRCDKEEEENLESLCRSELQETENTPLSSPRPPRRAKQTPLSSMLTENLSVPSCFLPKGQQRHVRVQTEISSPEWWVFIIADRSPQQYLKVGLFFRGGAVGGRLGVVTGRHQQVGEHQKLVIGEALPMLLPVVVVSAPELWKGLLHRHL